MLGTAFPPVGGPAQRTRLSGHLAAPPRGPRAAAAILPGAASPGSAARISRQPARPRSILVENRNGRSNRAGRRDVSPELRKGSTRDDAVIDAHREIIGRVASSALCEKGNAPRAIIGGSGVGRRDQRGTRKTQHDGQQKLLHDVVSMSRGDHRACG